MRATLLALTILFNIGCTNSSKIPKDVLSKIKMERVLWDIIQAERFSALYLLKDSASKDVQIEKFKFYDQVFNMHKISKDDFIKSYKYYLSRPDLAKVIFDSITVKAERQKTNAYKSPSVK